MKTPKRVMRILATLMLLSLTMVLSSAEVVGAQTDQPPSAMLVQEPNRPVIVPQGGGPVPGGPGFVSLNAFEFKPFDNTIIYAYTSTALINMNTSWKPFAAPVQLPQGAVINQVVVYFSDNNPTDNLYVNLYQINYFSNLPVLMASITATTTSTTWTYNTTSTINQPTIDNSRFSYYIRVDLPPATNVQLNAVRIDYGYPLSLPIVQR